MPKNALIAGSTGLIGQKLLNMLLASEDYAKVIALVRAPSAPAHRKLKEKVTDFDQLDLTALSHHTDDVFCCLGTTMKKAGSKEAFKKVDYHYPLEMARQAKKQGASSFHLVSALGADSQSKIVYNRIKGELEQALQQLNYHRLHIYRPSLLFGDRKEFRLGERVGIILAKAIGFLLAGSLKKYRGIDAEKVAQAMCTNAKDAKPGVKIHESDELQKYRIGT